VSDWVWIERSVILAAHGEQLAEHGGAAGVRDEGLLDSALARPLNQAAYGMPDAADLAAAYGFGLARNHPFIDGNKRTALIALELFLVLNGEELEVGDAECVLTILALADGELEEVELAAWIRGHLRSG
jgi:death on curing protein